MNTPSRGIVFGVLIGSGLWITIVALTVHALSAIFGS